jgi:hypothetical protein
VSTACAGFGVRIIRLSLNVYPVSNTPPMTAPLSRRLTRKDLSPLFVVAQCLDDQWVPPKLLRSMIAKGRTYADVAAVRNQGVRAEYRRALINARQVVVNRAFLYNTPAVIGDYMRRGDQRDAFKALLDDGTILPFLYSEASPTDVPNGHAYNEEGFAAWERLCNETEPACVRLDWDDAANAQAIEWQLTRRFSDFAAMVYNLDPVVLAGDLGLDPGEAAALYERLQDVARFKLLKGRTIRRTDLYAEFVNVDGTRPDEGKFDSGKRYAAEIKQLIDLNYNVNLPDALDGFALTPSGGVPRTALQEHHIAARKPITADQLVDIVQRFAFSKVQEVLTLESMADLTLADVVSVRGTDEWEKYASSVEDLMEDPFSFADPDRGAMAVYRNYAELAQQITNTVVERRVGRIVSKTEPFEPVIEFLMEAAGKYVIARWLPSRGMEVEIGGQVAKGFAKSVVPLVGRLIVRSWTERGGRTDMAMSADVFSNVIDGAEEQLNDLAHRLRPKPMLVPPEQIDASVANINVSMAA